MNKSQIVEVNDVVKFRLLIGCLSIFIIVGIIILLSFVNLRIYEESQRITINTRNSISLLENTAKLVRTVQSDIRGYTYDVTQVPPIIRPIVLSRPVIYDKRIQDNLNSIKEILSKSDNVDDHATIEDIDELERLIKIKLDFLDYFTNVVESENKELIKEIVTANYGTIYINLIESKINQIETIEASKLNENRNKREQAIARTKYIFVALATFSILFIFIAYILIRKSINSRQEAEKSLIESEGKLRNLTSKARDGLVTIDLYNKIIEWNKAAESIFGWSAEETIGKNLNIIIPEKYREGHRKGMERYAASGESNVIHQTVILEGLRKNNTMFPLELNVSAWKYNDEWYFSALLRDITTRVEADKLLEESRKELERSNEELEHFAYIASHDLQEPLRMVSSFCELLRKRYSDKLGPDGLEMIDFAVDGAVRMKKLIQSLLTYSRASREYEFQDVNLNEVCKIINLQLTSLIEETRAETTYENLPIVNGDESLLTQLFQNLIINAIKFRKKDVDPQITISVIKENKEWIFEVKDNGIGIDPQFNNKLFVIFQRLHSREEYEGTGIGLALCKKIVEKHKGRIWVESELGKGTSFLFSLPITEDKKCLNQDQ